jgi:hypothetical protein
MPNIKVNTSKYHIFIYKPTNAYAIIEKNADTVFVKLLVIYDHKFDKVSDNQVVQVQFLDFDSTKNAYSLMNECFKTIKVNELSNLSQKAKLILRLRRFVGL